MVESGDVIEGAAPQALSGACGAGPSDGDALDELIKLAMYAATQCGPGNFQFFRIGSGGASFAA